MRDVWMVSVLCLLTAAPAVAAEKEKQALARDDVAGHEPDVVEVQKAAARVAGFDLSRAGSMKRRAANSAWLPEVSVRLKKESFSNDGERYNTETPYQMFTAGEGIFYEVGLRWSLDQLIFDRKEIDASKEGAAIFQEYRRLMEDVARMYFARRLLLAEMAAGDPTREALVQKRLKVEEHTAMLDALCGGFFSREKARREKALPEEKR